MSVEALDRSNTEQHPAEGPPAARWPWLLGAAALAYLVLAVFFPILGFEFVGLDVSAQVTDNAAVRGLSPENLRQILTTWGNGGTTSSYYPVRTLTYAIDYQIWGADPRGFKLTNLLMHLANVLLVFTLVVRFLRRPAAAKGASKPWWDVAVATFSAGLFAVHPVVVEPVAWVAGREELLMTLGALGCFHLHLSARRLQEAGRTRRALGCYAGAGLFCAVACLSNAVAAVIPLLVTAWDVLTLARPKLGKIVRGTALLWMLGLATIGLKYACGRADLLKQPLDAQQADVVSALIQKFGYETELVVGETEGANVERVMLALNVFWRNLRTLFWPARLAVCYEPVTARSFLEADVLLGGLAVVLACAALWFSRRRKLLLFGLLWFGLALGPASQIMPHHIHRADRFLYLPLIGLAVAVAMGLRPLGGALRRRAAAGGAIAAGVLLLFVLDMLSAHQVRTWKNNITMWENCVRVSPDNVLAHRTLAKSLAAAGEHDRAFDHFKFVLRKNVFNVEALNMFAAHLATCDDKKLRDYELAIRLAEWARDLSQGSDPRVLHNLALAYNNYAVDLGQQGEFNRAVEYYQKASQTEPEYASPRFNLALLLATCPDENVRDSQKAVELAEQACAMTERPNANCLMILATTYAHAGRPDLAARTTEKAIAVAQAEGNAPLADLLRSRLERDQSSSQEGNRPPGVGAP